MANAKADDDDDDDDSFRKVLMVELWIGCIPNFLRREGREKSGVLRPAATKDDESLSLGAAEICVTSRRASICTAAEIAVSVAVTLLLSGCYFHQSHILYKTL